MVIIGRVSRAPGLALRVGLYAFMSTWTSPPALFAPYHTWSRLQLFLGFCFSSSHHFVQFLATVASAFHVGGPQPASGVKVECHLSHFTAGSDVYIHLSHTNPVAMGFCCGQQFKVDRPHFVHTLSCGHLRQLFC